MASTQLDVASDNSSNFERGLEDMLVAELDMMIAMEGDEEDIPVELFNVKVSYVMAKLERFAVTASAWPANKQTVVW